jgi:hypothetical protein
LLRPVIQIFHSRWTAIRDANLGMRNDAVRANGSVDQLNATIHPFRQAEMVGDGYHGLAVIINDTAQHLKYLLA